MRLDTAWIDDAECADRDLPISEFYFDKGSRDSEPITMKRSKRVCAVCPVRRECLGYALTVESSSQVLGVKTTIRCPDCHGEDDCEGSHAPHPMMSECAGCEATGQIDRQRLVSIQSRAWGLWGGQTHQERTRNTIRHLPGCTCGSRRGGCRPLEERIDILEELFSAQVLSLGIVSQGEVA